MRAVDHQLPQRCGARVVEIAVDKPPPLPPRKPRSRPASAFPEGEEPTKPTGMQFRVALLARYFAQCSPEDQDQLILEAERWAARNTKA